MNKSEASEQAYTNRRTVGELRTLIDVRRFAVGRSRINRDLTVTQVLDIFEAALENRPDDEIPVGSKHPARGMTRDGLLIRNILRECA